MTPNGFRIRFATLSDVIGFSNCNSNACAERHGFAVSTVFRFAIRKPLGHPIPLGEVQQPPTRLYPRLRPAAIAAPRGKGGVGRALISAQVIRAAKSPLILQQRQRSGHRSRRARWHFSDLMFALGNVWSPGRTDIVQDRVEVRK
jgi:hypothetical protein